MQEFLKILESNPILIDLMYSIVALLVAAILIKLSHKIFKKIKDINPDDNGYEDMIPFLENIAKLALFVILIFELLSIWGIDITPLLGAAGVAGIAVAFAAQDSISNLFGGISIFVDKPFRIGDQVLIGGTQRGYIYKVGARSTKIKTVDNVLVTIPNSVMVTNPIYNETGYDPTMKIRINIGIAYGSDLDQVEDVALKVLKSHENVLQEPEPAVLFTDFADSSIQLLAVATVANPQIQFKVKHELIKKIYSEFKRAGIEIPFPQRDVHLYKKN